ncbi:MAG: glycoside hydrolase family 3 N-terminal domain-containing protein [Streptosporangiaceae bacterium]
MRRPRPPLAGLLAVGLLTACGQGTTGTDASPGASDTHEAAATRRPACVERVLSGMSMRERVGQLFVAGVDSTHPTRVQLRQIRRHHLGGVILMGHSSAGVAEARKVAHRLQAQATAKTTDGVRLWIAVDQEGGYVQVLRGPGFSDIPTALTQGGLERATLRSRAHKWAKQLRAAGVNLNLAPVVDTVPASLGRTNKPVGYYDREYGHTPKAVAAHGVAFLEGMRSVDVQTTAKHFPGLGRVRGNTDTTYGVTDSVTTRHDAYLRPFKTAIDGGIPVVMVSSARYTEIDKRYLAPFSPVVLRGMLRHDLGFTGVIMSDDLGRAAAVKKVPVGERATRFLLSGGTVVLTVTMSAVPTMTAAVLRRAAGHPRFRAKVNAAATKVLRVKDRIGLLPC